MYLVAAIGNLISCMYAIAGAAADLLYLCTMYILSTIMHYSIKTGSSLDISI